MIEYLLLDQTVYRTNLGKGIFLLKLRTCNKNSNTNKNTPIIYLLNTLIEQSYAVLYHFVI